MRAANKLGFLGDQAYPRAQIIDRETGAADLVAALEWALSELPRPGHPHSHYASMHFSARAVLARHTNAGKSGEVVS
jgi:hypothetical protein